jgi:hypothetical protein
MPEMIAATRPPVFALALLILLPCAASAQEKRAGDCPAIDVPAPVSRLRVFVDPATGKLREPTAEELRELAENRLRERRIAAPRVFEVITYSDGMKGVDLGEAFLFDLRLSTLPDGTTKLECVPSAARIGRAEDR